MTEQIQENPHKEPGEPLPEAVVQTRSRISLVWLIPLVAAILGAWLAYKTYSEQGPIITITFKSAEGLEAGKTKIRYKNVDIGQVETIELSEDLSQVILTAQLVKRVAHYLTDKTRFWVVRARVSAGQVSGLSTLLGGAYIGIDPVEAGERTSSYTGLEVPPVVTTDDPGRHFMLHADELGSLEVGAPVYFRKIRVGEIVAYELDKSGQSVDVEIFIQAPHHERVTTNTRFWDTSGIDVSLSAGGLEVETSSMVSLLIGGIAFENPPGQAPGKPVEEGAVFNLYSKRAEAFAKSPERTSQWLLNFTGSVRGLEVGAPVEFRGIKLGRVTDVKLLVDPSMANLRIPVLIEIAPQQIELVGDPEAFYHSTDSEDKKHIFWNQLVAKGLRAQLKTGSLITGALYIDLDLHPKAKPQSIVWEGNYPELPTIPTPLEELSNALTNALQKFEQLPLDKMGNEVQQALAALSRTAVQVEKL
ncbi:MAG: MCE family protein, partial [Candidatus Competibacteraceae bacterium]|nr:MCE family protein [Candidatus Competibacteraceae bacterium]